MNRALLLGLLIFAMLVAGLALREGQLLILLMPLFFYLGAALLGTPEALAIQAYRDLHATAVLEGDGVGVTLTLDNTGPTLSVLEVTDLIPGQLRVREGATRLLTALPAGESLTVQYTLEAKRGAFDFPGVFVSVSETFNLFQREARLPAYARLTVLPRAGRLRSLAIRPRRTLGFAGPIPSRQSGMGVDFFGVRAYQPGDPLRRVNWRATARRPDQPFTTEFEQERTADVGLILDIRRQNTFEMGNTSLLEHSIQATAALAESLLHDGHRVGLLLYGRGLEWVFPGYGRVQNKRILRALASAGPGDSQVFASLDFFPARLFPARSQLLFISPLLTEDERMLFRLRAQGYAIMVVSPDPISFEVAQLPPDPLLALAIRMVRLERRLLLQRLRQAGIVVADWQVQSPLDDIIQTTIARAPRGGPVLGGVR